MSSLLGHSIRHGRLALSAYRRPSQLIYVSIRSTFLHPIVFLLHFYWLLFPCAPLKTPLACMYHSFNSRIYRGPAGTLTYTTSSLCRILLHLVWLLAVSVIAFLGQTILIYLKNPASCLFSDCIM